MIVLAATVVPLAACWLLARRKRTHGYEPTRFVPGGPLARRTE
jgi:hypothetical protein